jgi:drug/metabolite transporter (DMT)-like permease
MSRLVSHGLLLFTAMVWGVTFVAQTTGMEQGLGAFGFTAFRFLAGSVALLPLAIWEARKTPLIPILLQSTANKHEHLFLGTIALGAVMFIGSILQQVSLGVTSVANTAFLTTLYVPLVPVLGLILFRRNMHNWRWLAVGIFLIGSWLMSGASPKEAVIGDIIVAISALFWAFHIMLAGALAQRTNTPLQLAFSQTAITMVLSFATMGFVEHVTIKDVITVWPEIIFAGVLSTALAFTLQLVAQQHCSNAAAAIILSLEGVIAAISGWILLGQSMVTSAIIGAGFIFFAILLVELTPEHKRAKP